MRILVVEDDFISRRLLCRYLEPLGSCDIAVDGTEGVLAVRQSLEANDRYDLICLDIMMPQMDGREVLSRVRALEREFEIAPDKAARIIMTTALEDCCNLMDDFRAQCDGYVLKPIDRKKLLETIQKTGLPTVIGSGS
jgi:two-component system chemotaxis response regulator CheY